jgi:DNA repair ATPase RecN
VQVEQILNLRTDLMEAAEKLRRSEAERQQLETDITSLRQQVHTAAESCVFRRLQHAAAEVKKQDAWRGTQPHSQPQLAL